MKPSSLINEYLQVHQWPESTAGQENTSSSPPAYPLDELEEPETPIEAFTLENRCKANGELESPIEFVQRVYGNHMLALAFTSGTLKRIDKPLYDKVYAEVQKRGVPLSSVVLSARERLNKEIEQFDKSHKCYGDLPYREAMRIKTAKYRLKKEGRKIQPNFLKNFEKKHPR